jgi:hypothetical protein
VGNYTVVHFRDQPQSAETMNSLSEPGAVDQLAARLATLHETRPRAWGRMTPHEMFCHLQFAL